MRPRLLGDGKIDMGDGRRLYPCEARAELEAKYPPRFDADGHHSKDYWPWEHMWPKPIMAHFHPEVPA